MTGAVVIQKTAKLFMNGSSQAVRLPAEFRFDSDSVFIRKDAITGDVILSSRNGLSWQAFMAMRERLGPIPEDFLADREQSVQARDPFEHLNIEPLKAPKKRNVARKPR